MNNLKVRFIGSNSDGNAIIYENEILVDVGVSYTKLSPYIKDLKVVLLTHIHVDHFKKKTIEILSKKRPTLRFVCGDFLKDELAQLGVKNIDVLEPGKLYDYKLFKVSPVVLYHDVPNFGWRIFINNKKIFHATDTHTLEGIKAKDYDVYAIEYNYDENVLNHLLDTSNEYEHGYRSRETHLSVQQAKEFIEINKVREPTVLKLHRSKRYGGVENE